MALSTATISYDIADLIGTDFDIRRTKVWVSTNIADGTVIDTVGNAIRVDTGQGTLAADGTGSVTVWTPGTGSNPDSWQTYVHLDYASPMDRTRKRRTFGPFTVTTAANLADLVEEQEVPAEYLTAITATLDAYADSAAAASVSAAASATSAAASAAAAVVVAGLSTSDALVASLVEDTGSDTYAALTVSPPLKRIVPADTIVIWGDSITAQCSIGATPDDTYGVVANPGLHRYTGVGYYLWANVRLRGRLRMVRNAGEPSQTTAVALARFEDDVLAYQPAFCVIGVGIGSITALVSTATHTAEITQMVQLCIVNGIIPVLTTVLPTDWLDSDPKKVLYMDQNLWRRYYASITPGVLLCDWAAVYADTTGYAPRTGVSADGTHPGYDGATLLGEVLAEVLEPYLTSTPDLVSIEGEAVGSNPHMGGAGTVADGYSHATMVGAAATPTLVTRTDGKPGKWQQLVRAAAGRTWIYRNTPTNWAVGDRVVCELEFERDNDWSNVSRFGAYMDTTGGASPQAASCNDVDATAHTALSRWPTSGVFRTPELTIPTGTTSVNMIFDFQADAGTVRIGRFCTRKVI